MRGRPLIVLSLMMVGWIGMRFALWPQETLQALERAVPATILAESEPRERSTPAIAGAESGSKARPRSSGASAFLASPLAPHKAGASAVGRAVGGPVDEAGAHDLLWIAAVARGAYGFPAPAIASDVGRMRTLPFRSELASDRRATEVDRWSLDGWLLWRPDGRGSAAVAPASYGASQAGVLLSYRLAPGSRFAPRAYARATGFPDGVSRVELAAGLAIRPLAGLPVRAQAELRASERDGRIEVRPAAMLVGGARSEMLGLEADVYGQAGYVGGGDATAFADGRLTLRKALASGGGFRLAAGGGVWGGAQQGAARVDVGPSAAMTLATGQLTARVEADYRIRVAGDANPGSGPALTVSASF